jgi:hypothetical protein
MLPCRMLRPQYVWFSFPTSTESGTKQAPAFRFMAGSAPSFDAEQELAFLSRQLHNIDLVEDASV